jgi:hypothetical protein
MRKSFLATALLIAVAAFTHAGEIDPGRLFASVPTPPQTIVAAVSQVRITRTDRVTAEAPAYDALTRKVEETEHVTGNKSAQQQINQTGLNIDFQRMQTDPAYAAKVQAQMEGMSDARKMEAVRRWQEYQNYGNRPTAGLMAHAKVTQSFAEQKTKNDDALRDIMGMYRTAMQAEAERHDAVDKAIEAALEKCPTDSTGMEKVWSCAGPLKNEALRKHREAETSSLADEKAAYAKARTTAQARVDGLLPLMNDAKKGGQASDVAMVSGQIGEFTRVLAKFGRTIALRAAFWGEPGLTSEFIDATHLRFTVQTHDKQVVEWPGTDDL